MERFSDSLRSGGLLSYIDALSGGSISRVGLFSLGKETAIFQILTAWHSIFPSAFWAWPIHQGWDRLDV